VDHIPQADSIVEPVASLELTHAAVLEVASPWQRQANVHHTIAVNKVLCAIRCANLLNATSQGGCRTRWVLSVLLWDAAFHPNGGTKWISGCEHNSIIRWHLVHIDGQVFLCASLHVQVPTNVTAGTSNPWACGQTDMQVSVLLAKVVQLACDGIMGQTLCVSRAAAREEIEAHN